MFKNNKKLLKFLNIMRCFGPILIVFIISYFFFIFADRKYDIFIYVILLIILIFLSKIFSISKTEIYFNKGVKALGKLNIITGQCGNIKYAKLKKAMKYFKKSIEACNKNIYAYINLSFCYIRFQKYREAKELLEKAKNISPKSIQIFDNLAYCEDQLLNHSKAIEYYKIAKKYKNTNILLILYFSLCFIVIFISHHQNRFIFFFFGFFMFSLLYSLIFSYLPRNSFVDKSRKYFEKGLKKLGIKKLLNEKYDSINIKSYKKAIKYFEKSIQFDNKESYGYVMLSFCYIKLNEYKKAYNILKDGIKIVPNNLLILKYLIQCKENILSQIIFKKLYRG